MNALNNIISVNYQNLPSPLREFVNNYFSLDSTQERSPSCAETTLKVMTFATLVIPLLIFTAKLFSYLCCSPRNVTQVSSVPDPQMNSKVEMQLKSLMAAKNNRLLYWISHPKFEKGDDLNFPHKKVHFLDVNRYKDAVEYFGKGKASKISRLEEGYNDFLQWLNGETTRMDRGTFYRLGTECFMNCTDFVYLALYQAGLIEKEKIKSIYKKQIQSKIEDEDYSKSYYGFDLEKFKDFDPQKGGKPGDILIGFMNGKPTHILFLSEKEQVSEHWKGKWKGIGLWNMGNFEPTLSDTALERLQFFCTRNKQDLTFKSCSLQTALEHLVS